MCPSNSVTQLLSRKKKRQVGFAQHKMQRKVGPNNELGARNVQIIRGEVKLSYTIMCGNYK